MTAQAGVRRGLSAAALGLLALAGAMAQPVAGSAGDGSSSLGTPAQQQAARRQLAKRLLGELNLPWLHSEPTHLANRPRWALGVASDGPLRWRADLYRSDTSGTHLATGLHWPMQPGLSLSLLQVLPLDHSAERQLVLGARIGF